MNQAYNPPSSVTRWQKRFSARGWGTAAFATPFSDHPEWISTEAQHLLAEQIMAEGTMPERQRAAMLGMSKKMVHHNITEWLKIGMLRLRGKTATGVLILAVAKDWIITRTPPATVMEKLRRWRERRQGGQWAAMGSATTVDEKPSPTVGDVASRLIEMLGFETTRSTA